MAKRNTKWTLQDLKAYAKLEHAGKCLSSDYTRNDRKYLWKCKNKLHEPFEAGWDNVNRGGWCTACLNDKLRMSFKTIKSKVKELGGKIITKKNEYINSKTPINYLCEKGHKVTSDWGRISKVKIGVSGKLISWCPTCSGWNRNSIQELQKIAKSKGGVLLSKAINNNKEKLKWKCANDHEFWLNAHNLKQNQWCSKCSASIGENLTRYYLEHLFKVKFSKKNPEWLTFNTSPLELDGYNSRNNIAFEYQGVQHKKYTPYFHRNGKVDFENQQKRDEFKRKTCNARGVKLIEIDDESTGRDELFDKIIEECRRFNLVLRRSTKPNIESFYKKFYKNDLIPILKIVNEKNGECLENVYQGENVTLIFKCQRGHKFTKTPTKIKAGIWCPEAGCNPKARDENKVRQYIKNKGGTMRGTYTNRKSELHFICEKGHTNKTTWASLNGHWCSECAGNKWGTIEEMRKIASTKGGRCLSEKYLGSGVELEWECNKNHRSWFATPSNVKTKGSWCPKCAPNSMRSLKDMKNLARKFNGKCNSIKYHNTQTKLDWECSKHHVWTATPNNVLKGNWCPECRKIKKKEIILEKINKIAIMKEGICLSKKYVDNFTELKFKCRNNHTWKVSPKNLFRGSWCKQCN